MHTSPGIPLIIGGRPTTSYNSSRQQRTPVLLPRHWHAQDVASKIIQERQLAVLLAARTYVPEEFLEHKEYTLSRAATAVHIQFRVIVRPDGLPAQIVLVNQKVENPSVYSTEAINLLEHEAHRSIATLRFMRALTQDTIVVPVSFYIQ